MGVFQAIQLESKTKETLLKSPCRLAPIQIQLTKTQSKKGEKSFCHFTCVTKTLLFSGDKRGINNFTPMRNIARRDLSAKSVLNNPLQSPLSLRYHRQSHPDDDQRVKVSLFLHKKLVLYIFQLKIQVKCFKKLVFSQTLFSTKFFLREMKQQWYGSRWLNETSQYSGKRRYYHHSSSPTVWYSLVFAESTPNQPLILWERRTKPFCQVK